MNRLLLTLTLLTLTLLALSARTFAAEKYALLIGVTTYENAHMNRSPLKYPEADAKAIAEVFEQSGYKVVTVLGDQATKAEIENALAVVAKSGDSDGIVAIGLSGHGVQNEQDSYFVPFDAKMKAVTDFKGKRVFGSDGEPLQQPDPESLVSLRTILDSMAMSPSGSRLLLADIGREQPLRARSLGSRGSGLRVSDLPEETAVLFSCSNHERSFESDTWGHSAFVSAFLNESKALKKVGSVYAGTLADRMRPAVSKSVEEMTGGRHRQTVQFMLNHNVDLQLTNPISGASDKK